MTHQAMPSSSDDRWEVDGLQFVGQAYILTCSTGFNFGGNVACHCYTLNMQVSSGTKNIPPKRAILHHRNGVVQWCSLGGNGYLALSILKYASKRKHSTLTLKDKLEVLKRLDKGEGVTKLATEFNVGKARICDWRKNRRKLEQYCANSSGETLENRQTAKQSLYDKVDSARFIFGLPRKKTGNSRISD
ncbi:uncharacterized protein TNCV_894431 [Trichonephila clavipes]|nr:uncharacterized protein TNCV_894431 [Trichonephila clavipes]